MPKVVLQVGHQNIKFNSIEALHGSTGAPKELEHNLNITNRTCELLRERGFEVIQTDANANDDPSITYPNDWDMYLAVHCDADTSSNGGFTDYPLPATDGATLESQRIADAIAAKFFPESGITYRPDRRQRSVNIQYYYMWKYLSAKTPCVLIEMGESVDAHDSVILNDTERCAVALARGVCNAFNVPYDQSPPEPPKPPVDPCEDLKEQVNNLESINEQQVEMIEDLQDKNRKLNEANSDLVKANMSIETKLEECESKKCPELKNCPSWLKRLNTYFCK